MNRRTFIDRTLKLLAGGLLLPGAGRHGLAHGLGGGVRADRLGAMAELRVLDGKILILVNLSGGNDGLNTVVPVDDPLYYAARPTLAIPPEQAVPLGGGAGLHPQLAPLASLYEAGRMAILRGVTYPNPNLSHFRSTDIWFSGSASTAELRTGWLARFVEALFPEFPNELPFAPYGLQQGTSHEIPLQGDRGVIGVVIDNPDTFYELVNQNYTGEWDDEPPDTRGGEELRFVREVDVSTFQYAEAIAQAADAGVNTVAYPQTNLGIQLEIVARLISGDLDTPVYLASEFGFDTHVSQANQHANLMASVGYSLAAFFADLDNQGLADQVVVASTSEFGRRVEENGGFGTDHGTAAPLFVAGAGVNGGLYGTNPDLGDLDPYGNMRLQHDFRSVYATLLRGHFGASEALAGEVLLGDFEPVDFLDIPTGAAGATPPLADKLFGAFPNPASQSRSGRVLLRFDLARASRVEAQVFDLRGRRVSHLGARDYPAGRHRLSWDVSGLATGIYMARLDTGAWSATEKLLVLP